MPSELALGRLGIYQFALRHDQLHRHHVLPLDRPERPDMATTLDSVKMSHANEIRAAIRTWHPVWVKSAKEIQEWLEERGVKVSPKTVEYHMAKLLRRSAGQ